MRYITIEDCLEKVENRFELIRLISQRTKHLTKGSRPLVETKNEKNISVSMREISEGKVFFIKDEQ